jgi:predicted RNA-binding Zn-ribbon protein involved in translation (DUF1610 family)
MSMMTVTVSKSGFFIGVTCPGCGSNLEIESDFFVLTCSHCGSNLRIIMPETPPAYLIRSEKPITEIRFHVDRYLKGKSLPLTGSDLEITRIYYPYWRIDAVVLKVRNKIVERFPGYDDGYGNEISYEKKQTDINLTPYVVTQAAGPECEYIPHSAGLRSEYTHTVPFSTENTEEGFVSLPAVRNWSQVTRDLQKSLESVDAIDAGDFGNNRTKLFRPVGSIFYLPYFIIISPVDGRRRQIIADGKSGRIVNYIDDAEVDNTLFSAGDSLFEFGSLRVEHHRCSNCGQDLPPEQSFLYICRNCRQVISLGKHALPVSGLFVTEASIGSSDRLFPFWALKVNDSEAKKIRFLLGGIYDTNRLVIPAFRTPNFEAVYRLAKRLYAAFPKMKLAELEQLDSRYANVTLSLSEALTLAEALIYREKISKDIKNDAFNFDFQPIEAELFYAPFHPQSYFYVDSVFGAVTFEKSLVD